MPTTPVYDASPAEIRAACATFRASWAPEVLARRAGLVREEYVVPVVERAELVGAARDAEQEEV